MSRRHRNIDLALAIIGFIVTIIGAIIGPMVNLSTIVNMLIVIVGVIVTVGSLVSFFIKHLKSSAIISIMK